MIIVTGAAGFIGSNIIKSLNQLGYFNIVAIDDLSDGTKIFNLADCKVADYIDKDEFLRSVVDNAFPFSFSVIFDQGACSVTTEWDGKFMLENNYEYSKKFVHFFLQTNSQFIYASCAFVYGGSKQFFESAAVEHLLNVSAYFNYL